MECPCLLAPFCGYSKANTSVQVLGAAAVELGLRGIAVGRRAGLTAKGHGSIIGAQSDEG